MSTNVFLGMPPPKIKEWIEKNYVKPWPEKTSVVYNDGTTWEGLIEGELTNSSIPNKNTIKQVIVGTKVTSINNGAFFHCTSLTTIYIPDNMISISQNAFEYCNSISSLPNSSTSQVKQWFNEYVFGDGINYDHDGPAEMTIICKDGTVHAVGIWIQGYSNGEGWNITITSL